MKTIADAAMDAIEAGEAVVTGAVVITPKDGVTPTLRYWGGYGTLTYDGHDYLGLGHRGLAQQTSNAMGGVANGIVLAVSGVEPEALSLLDPDEVKGAAVVIYRLIFASDGRELLDFHVFDRGRGDAVDTEDVIGGTATIKFSVESSARGLGRSGARMQADYDQRLINSSDGYMRNKAYAQEKSLYWGGKKPTRAAVAVG